MAHAVIHCVELSFAYSHSGHVTYILHLVKIVNTIEITTPPFVCTVNMYGPLASGAYIS